MNDQRGTWPSPDIIYTDIYAVYNNSNPSYSNQPDRPLTWLTTLTTSPKSPTHQDTILEATTTTTALIPPLDPCNESFQVPYPDLTQLPWVVTLLTVVYLVVMILSVCGNALVILTVWKNNHMHTVTNYYIVNLAVSDLLVSVLVMPLKLLEYTSPCAWNVFANPVLCPILYYILPIFVFASVLTLVAISLERYYAIVHPLSAMKFNSKSRTRRILAATWTIPMVLASPYTFSKSYPFVISSEMGSISRQICTDRFDEIDAHMYGPDVTGRFRSGFFIFLFLVIYLLPMLVILATCVRIAVCLLQPISVRRWPPAPRKDNGRRHEENKRKVARMVIVVAVAFIVSWSPFYLSTLVSQIQSMGGGETYLQERNFLFTMLMIHFCGFLNSCINPLIYTGMSKKFRRSFKKILSNFICCRLTHRLLRYRDSLNRGMSAAFTSSYRQSMTEVRDANDLALSDAGSSSCDSTTRYGTRSNQNSLRSNHSNILQRNIYHQRRHHNNNHHHHLGEDQLKASQLQVCPSPELQKKSKKGGFKLLKSGDKDDITIKMKPLKKKGKGKNAQKEEDHEDVLLNHPDDSSLDKLTKEVPHPILKNGKEHETDVEDGVGQGTQQLVKDSSTANPTVSDECLVFGPKQSSRSEDCLASKAKQNSLVATAFDSIGTKSMANGGSHQILRDSEDQARQQGQIGLSSDIVRSSSKLSSHVPNQYEEVVHAGFIQDGPCVQL